MSRKRYQYSMYQPSRSDPIGDGVFAVQIETIKWTLDYGSSGWKPGGLSKFPEDGANEHLRKLIDDYIDDWNKLSDNSQMYATLYFLAGTPTRDKSGKPVKRVNVMKLLPISLMHKPMIKSFAKVWWNMMTKNINSKFKQPKDTRGEMYKGLKFGESVELSKKIADRFCG